MNNPYTGIISGYQNLLDEIQKLFSGLSDAECYKKINEKSWSAIQVIVHLNITANGYLNFILKKFSDDKKLPRGKVSEIKFTLMGKILKMFGPEGKIRIKAPAVLRPVTENPDRVATLNEFYSIQNEIISLIQKCEIENINVNRIKIPSPVSPIVKVNLGEFFIFTLGHERRHLNQVKRILQSLSD